MKSNKVNARGVGAWVQAQLQKLALILARDVHRNSLCSIFNKWCKNWVTCGATRVASACESRRRLPAAFEVCFAASHSTEECKTHRRNLSQSAGSSKLFIGSCFLCIKRAKAKSRRGVYFIHSLAGIKQGLVYFKLIYPPSYL
jgi:hypothetical protein